MKKLALQESTKRTQSVLIRRQGYVYAAWYGLKLTTAFLRVMWSAILQQLRARMTILSSGLLTSNEQPIAAASADLLTSCDFMLINEPGFGDRWNSYPWSMQWWQGKLHVGTNRAFPCVEYFAIHSAIPFVQRYPPRFDPDIRCPDSPYDLPLQAEIWCYTPETEIWECVYQSPNDVEIPDHPGRYMARDIGFRDMLVFSESDGTEALYVSGVSARSINHDGPPPRILRSTDGLNFEAIPYDPGPRLGELKVVGFRSLATYKGRLYVTAGVLYGDGVLLEAENPTGGHSHFRQVSPEGMRVFEIVPFNGFLYLGLRHPLKGYAVVKTDAAGTPPYTFITVVPYGGFRKPWRSSSVVSMHVFKDRLYVGTDSPAELLRIYPDDRWDLIVGKPRKTPDGMKFPLSGMGEGFDYALNRIIERMQEYNGWLYIGTVNFAGKFRTIPVVGQLVRSHIGFDLYATSDGVHFSTITCTGFNSVAGGSVRTFASTPVGLFLGAINENCGAKVYLGTQLKRG